MITKELITQHGLSEAEYAQIKELLGREPNLVELGLFSVMWSEHCSYKNSKAVLKSFPTQGKLVLQGPGENAGVIDLGEGLGLVFKIESHNHPSAVEPFQGAATGVGGIIRDIFAMGARPICLLNSLRFGESDNPRTQYLLKGVVAGIASYGNCMGIPTVGGEVYFEKPYQENPLVNAMCVGVVEISSLVKAIASGEGNTLLYVGATTGRDGIHGATFASAELRDDSHQDRPSVQIGDPFTEKLLLEACLEVLQAASRNGGVIGLQDMGAAGLTSSSSEMASRGESGIEIDVSLVPRREEGMTPYEVMLSESQERMLFCIKEGTEDIAKEILAKWDLNSVAVGKVTRDGMLRVKDGEVVVAEVPVKALTEAAPIYEKEGTRPHYQDKLQQLDPSLITRREDFNQVLLKLMASPNITPKTWIYEQYDHMVGTNTVILPGQADAALLRIKGLKKLVAVTTDGNGRYCYLDPFRGGAIAVAEAARNLVCVGAKPLAVTDCLNFGNPEKPEIYWQFQRVVEGMSMACRILETPVVSGNVSFYNESPEGAVYPSPVVGMVGLINNAEPLVKGPGFCSPGDIIVLLGETKEEIGGSEYLKVIHNCVTGRAPTIDLEIEKQVHAAALTAIQAGIIHTAHDCAEGGLAVALSESCLMGGLGADIFTGTDLFPVPFLFGESQSRILLALAEENLSALEHIARENRIPFRVIGQVGGERLVINDLIDLPLGDLAAVWRRVDGNYSKLSSADRFAVG
ncbi:MAG: phosphoribosylformylglycinamidine synthase subunit PurL [bacterium]